MRIKILKEDAYAVVQFDNGKFILHNCPIEECCFSPDIENHIKSSNPTPCITQCAPIETRFFFKMLRFHNKIPSGTCGAFGFLQKNGDQVELVVEKVIQGNRFFPELQEKFLVSSFSPPQDFFNDYFDRSILTSDGVITLSDNQFVGVKDGLIEELDVQEVLDIISKGKTEKSPLYKQVRLQSLRKRPARPARGTIIYNEVADEFEVYGKNGWRTLKSEET